MERGRRAEPIRAAASALVALTSSALLLGCLVTVPDLALRWPTLRLLTTNLAGWGWLAAVVAFAVAVVCLVGGTRAGAAPALALGAVAAVLGTALARDISSSAELVLALLSLAVAVGALFAAGICLVDEAAGRRPRLVLAAWLLPLTAGWALLGDLVLRSRSAGRVSLGTHPPLWLVALAAAVLLLWAVVSQLGQPGRPRQLAAAGWENSWAALGTLVTGAGSIGMLLGFSSGSADDWVRPLVLLGTAAGLAALIGGGLLLVPDAARSPYLALVVALLGGPTCLHVLMLVSSRASGPLPAPVTAVLTAAGLVGSWVGWRWAERSAGAGLLLMAAGAAAGWVMPASAWGMLAGAVPLALGLGCASTAALRLAARSAMGLRLVATAGLVSLVFGLLMAFPLTWALGAELTARALQARAGGRILLGLTFALSVLAAAGVSVLRRRSEGSRPTIRGFPPDDPRVPARRSEGSRPTIRGFPPDDPRVRAGYVSRKPRMVEPEASDG